jgi:hypothetical protein
LLSNNAASEYSASEFPHAGTSEAAAEPCLNAYYVLSVFPIQREVNNVEIMELEFRRKIQTYLLIIIIIIISPSFLIDAT